MPFALIAMLPGLLANWHIQGHRCGVFSSIHFDEAHTFGGGCPMSSASMQPISAGCLPKRFMMNLSSGTVASVLDAILEVDAAFGRSEQGESRSVMVEFVSANPTVPLHLGHGRQAALGDGIASLLEWTGWRVHREYYYNDSGRQMRGICFASDFESRSSFSEASAWGISDMIPIPQAPLFQEMALNSERRSPP